MSLKSLTTCISNVWRQNGHNILTGCVITGVLVTTTLAVNDTIKAVKKVEKLKEEKRDEVITKKELIKTVAPCYIPTAIGCTVTIASALGLKVNEDKRVASFANAYALSETSRKLYEDATEEVVGEEKSQEIRDKVAEKQIRNSEYRSMVIPDPGTDLVRCFDTVSKQYYMSTRAKIEDRQAKVNNQISNGDWFVSHNEFNEGLGVDFDPDIENLGYNIDRPVDVIFSSMICDDGVPCLVVNYRNGPVSEYTNIGFHG